MQKTTGATEGSVKLDGCEIGVFVSRRVSLDSKRPFLVSNSILVSADCTYIHQFRIVTFRVKIMYAYV